MLFSLNIRISMQSFDKAAPLAVKGRRRFLVKITFAQVNRIFSFSFFAFKIRYLSVECHVLCPYQPPQSPQTSFALNTLVPL